jgi:3-oxoadipate enol-lactonase
LVAAGFRVIVPDHAGHGASARLSEPFSVADLANDVELMLAHLEIAEFDLVGLSLGGMVALELALRHPERIGRLVVANSFMKTNTDGFRSIAEGWAIVFEQPHGAVTRLEQNWPGLVSQAFRDSPDGIRTYQIWHGIAATTDGASLANIARGIVDFDVSERLGALTMPSLFIAGELDGMSVPDISRRMAELAPEGRYELIGGAGHISNVDSAEEFSRHLIAFLQNPLRRM